MMTFFYKILTIIQSGLLFLNLFLTEIYCIFYTELHYKCVLNCVPFFFFFFFVVFKCHASFFLLLYVIEKFSQNTRQGNKAVDSQNA